jgi:hypothetical protein
VIEQKCEVCGVASGPPAQCWPQRHGKTVCQACAGIGDALDSVPEVPAETRERLADWIDREQLAAENRKLRAVYEAAQRVLLKYGHNDWTEWRDLADAIDAVRAVEES